MKPPKISIITPSFNQSEYLEETILSVLNQRYQYLEYIVIDGGSDDGSKQIIQKYQDRLSYWESEADRGQVHAINKGLEHVTGDVVAFINSDDVYLAGALSAVSEYFNSNPECVWLCGDTVKFGEGHRTELIRARVPRSAAHCVSWDSNAPQPGMFWRRELLSSGFDERWRYCFDHDLYVRLLLQKYKCEHLSLPIAGYRLHKTSKTVSESSRFDDEFDMIARHYEPALSWSGRRWSVSTRYLRLSYGSSRQGEVGNGIRWLAKAIAKHPEGMMNRPVWGCLRQAMAAGAFRTLNYIKRA